MVLNPTDQLVPPAHPDKKEKVVFKTIGDVLRSLKDRRTPPFMTSTVITVPCWLVGIRSGGNRSARKVVIPRRLGRPAFKAISHAALEAVDPELKGVSLEEIHKRLLGVGQRWFTAMETTKVKAERTCFLGSDLDIVVNSPAADAPTLILAASRETPIKEVFIFPVHALVIAAYCTNSPILPSSKPATPPEVGATLTLPVLGLRVQNVETFPIFLKYLYTRSLDKLLLYPPKTSHFLPWLLSLPPGDARERLVIRLISRKFASTFNVLEIISQVKRVYMLWHNVVVLGVFDEGLWRQIEAMWEVLLGALEISTADGWSWKIEEAPQDEYINLG